MVHIFDSVKRFFAAMFQASSSDASNINTLFLQFLILSLVIMLIVAGMVFIGGYRYRRKVQPDVPNQIHHNKKLELTWTILPLLAVSFFFILTVRSMKQINQPCGGWPGPRYCGHCPPVVVGYPVSGRRV